MNPLKPWTRKGRRVRKAKRKTPASRVSSRARARARGRREDRPRARTAAVWLLALAGTAAVAVALSASDLGAPLGWLRSERFHLRAIDVLGLKTLEPSAVLTHAGLEPGLPLIDIDLQAVLEAVRQHPRVSESRGARLPPDRLLLEVTERTPAAAIEGERVGVDFEGARFALADGEADDLPVIAGAPEQGLPLLEAARRAGYTVERIEVRSVDDLRLELANEPVRIRVGRDPERSLADWSVLRANGGVEALGAREVDLRFPGSAILPETGRE